MGEAKSSFQLPHRGEIWDVDWSPGRGSEQAGIRPALIIQNDYGNLSNVYPNTIVIAISTKGRSIPFHVRIKPSPINGLEKDSYIKCEQILTISKIRLLANGHRGCLTNKEMIKVEAAIRLSLAIH